MLDAAASTAWWLLQRLARCAGHGSASGPGRVLDDAVRRSGAGRRRRAAGVRQLVGAAVVVVVADLVRPWPCSMRWPALHGGLSSGWPDVQAMAARPGLAVFLMMRSVVPAGASAA